VGYNVDLIQIPPQIAADYPAEGEFAEELISKAIPFDDVETVRRILLTINGTKSSTDGGIDYLGRGLSYARIYVNVNAVHIDNNLSCEELIKIYHRLLEKYRSLAILDLQSRQLHDADSFRAWWSRPL